MKFESLSLRSIASVWRRSRRIPVATIVIIDDHEMFREGLASLVQKSGQFELLGQADDGKSGLQLIEDVLPDVAVVDVSMPSLGGLDVLQSVKYQKLRSKVILLTSSDDPGLARKAVDRKVDGYVLKEDAYRELQDAILAVSEGKQYLSPSISAALISTGSATSGPAGSLSKREREVLAWIAEGLTDKEIADSLSIGIGTVRTHRTRIREKLDLHTPGELVRFAVDHDIVIGKL